jgi:hypothetical protein
VRTLVALMITFAACDKGAKPRQPFPAGPYTVRYACLHKDEPFGNDWQSRDQSFDLGARTFTQQSFERSDEVPPPPETRPLAADRVVAINAAVEKVLSGGPYKPEFPVPEGTPCTLTITGPGGKSLFKIEKAAAENPDAVSDLVSTLVP